ncbi:hypothetical protein OIU85_008059 [Salix viminalis]|uniref:Uncharacterized protein n=1 Tax=Salix viminalis TaxID=40686 RepID=A0A9Q0PA93_SALVM|nr:hypothetical protein OIU85_008059 [Salix viminalis]
MQPFIAIVLEPEKIDDGAAAATALQNSESIVDREKASALESTKRPGLPLNCKKITENQVQFSCNSVQCFGIQDVQTLIDDFGSLSRDFCEKHANRRENDCRSQVPGDSVNSVTHFSKAMQNCR